VHHSDSAITGSAVVSGRGAVGLAKGSSEGDDAGQAMSDGDVSDSSRSVGVDVRACGSG
jgi:hypothetical protein